MSWKGKWKKPALMAGVFGVCYFLPVGGARFDHAVGEALRLARWYAREHVLLCLVPAFFIAGAISVFVGKSSVMKYLGPRANKVLAYGVASVSGSVLAVCSCTVLPLFSGIWRMGAGIGPATAFLYAGPAVNILAIILTARILGLELGIARTAGAVVFSIVIGLLMHLIFRKEQLARTDAQAAIPPDEPSRSLGKNALLFAAMAGILVFANWARSGDVRAVFLCCPGGLSTYRVEGTVVSQSDRAVTIVDAAGSEHRIPVGQLKEIRDVRKNAVYEWIYRARWPIVAALLAAFGVMVARWFRRAELGVWAGASWDFAVQILPLLLIGVLLAGLLLGSPGGEGLIPPKYVEMLVGQRPDMFLGVTGLAGGPAEAFLRASWPIFSNLCASVAGALMYFATLTEVLILEGLLRAGMGRGPALALLLAGPALSLPNMLVIRSVIGTRKTLVYVLLVVVMATLSGMLFGLVRG